VSLSRRDPQPRLGGVERRRGARPDRRPRDLPGRAVDTAGNVTRDDHRPIGARVDRVDRAVRGLTRDAGKAGAENRVDDPGGGVERLSLEPARRRPRKPLEVGARIAAQVVGIGEQQHGDLAADLAQQPGRHEAVAAVVAPAADDGDRAGRHKFLDQLRKPAAGALHQVESGDPELADRPLVQRALLGGVRKPLEPAREGRHSTVTVLARLRGWSTLSPR